MKKTVSKKTFIRDEGSLFLLNNLSQNDLKKITELKELMTIRPNKERKFVALQPPIDHLKNKYIKVKRNKVYKILEDVIQLKLDIETNWTPVKFDEAYDQGFLLGRMDSIMKDLMKILKSNKPAK